MLREHCSRSSASLRKEDVRYLPRMAANGVRAFAASLKEVRILLCQKGESSRGAREFLEHFYIPLKEQNPQLPILVRECSGVTPKIHARYEYGRENSVDLSGMKKEQVLDTINSIADARC